MMHQDRNFLALFLIILLFSPQTWSLDSRNSNIPISEVVESGRIRVEVENTRAPIHDETVSGTASDHNSSTGVLWGGPNFGIVGIELGVDWKEPQENDSEVGMPELLLLNFRAATTTMKEWGFAGALGIREVGFVAEENDYNIMYGVFEHRMWQKFYFAYGVYAGSNLLLVDETGNDESKGFFLGIWYDTQPNGRGRFGVEWVSGESQISRMDVGLSVEFDHGVFGNVSVVVPNNPSLRKTAMQFRLAVDI